MSHATHEGHSHDHGPDCGHTAIAHGDHTCYLHDGHLHMPHEDHVDCHVLEVGEAFPGNCTEGHQCAGHAADHVHGPDCGHQLVPHGDHMDYLVDGHLHHSHGGHCDHHGALS